MLGLALDSATSGASAALWRNRADQLECGPSQRVSAPDFLGSKELSPGIGKADQLIVVIEELLEAAGLAYQDLDIIAANRGPGSFTGIRSTIALARGLALATGKPTIGVTSLEAIAAEIGRHGLLAKEDPPRSLMVVEDARRGEVYCQSFREDLRPLTDPHAEAPETVADQLSSERWWLAGSGAALVQDQMGGAADVIIHDETSLTAEGVAIAASRRLALGEPPVAGFDLSPLYIRAPDAIKPKPLVSPIAENIGA